MFDQHFADEKDRSRVIDLFRLVAILCVVMVHVPYHFSKPDNTDALAYMRTLMVLPFADQAVMFFKYGLGRVASPALSLVSAWFLLRTLDQKPFRTVLTSKAQNLLIPYVAWGLIYILFMLGVFLLTGKDQYHFAEGIPRVLWNSTFNLLDWPANGPLHYLFDLFEIIIAYALCHRFIYPRKWLLMACLLASPLVGSYLGHSQSWLGDNKLSLLPRVDLVFYFLVGVLTFRTHEQIFSRRTVALLTNPLLVLVLVALTVLLSKVVFYYTEALTPEATAENIAFLYATLLIRGISSLCVFALALILYRAFKPGIPRKVVFRIFCSHALVIWIVNALVNDVLSEEHLLLRYGTVFLLSILGGWMISLMLDRVQKLFRIPLIKYL